MKYQEIIDEAVTLREFKFGFEFECYLGEEFDKDIIEDLPINFEITDDQTLDENSKGIELVSEVLTLNPSNIIKSKQCIIDLLNEGCFTDSTCGFHVHYSYNGMDYNEICWLLIVLSTNDEYRELFTEFKDIDFINKKYASDDFFYYICDILEIGEGNITHEIIPILGNEKYRLLRIHPSGTLEWRGPRNFMNSKNFGIISDFFVRLYKVADLIDKISKIKSVTVDNKVFTKDSLINYLKNNPEYEKDAQYNKPNNIKVDKRFNKDQNRELIGEIFKIAPWLSKAKFEDAIIDIDKNTNKIIWVYGIWEDGTWKDGYWKNGIWLNGKWMNGNWKDGTWKDGTWLNGTWENGIWKNGTWENGIWKNGNWLTGIWKNGTWDRGYINTNPPYGVPEYSGTNPRDCFKNK